MGRMISKAVSAVLGNPVAMAAILAIAIIASHGVGRWIGHRNGFAEGVARQKEKQAAADAKAAADILDRVEGSRDEIDAGNPDDVNRRLRELAPPE